MHTGTFMNQKKVKPPTEPGSFEYRGVWLKPYEYAEWGVHSLLHRGGNDYRLTLVNDSIGRSLMPKGPDTTRIFTVARKNQLGLTIRSWVFLYKYRLWTRDPGNGQRGQYHVSAGRWSTSVSFLGVFLPPEWERTSENVVRLANTYDEDVSPVLADALEDVGCADQVLLPALRTVFEPSHGPKVSVHPKPKAPAQPGSAAWTMLADLPLEGE